MKLPCEPSSGSVASPRAASQRSALARVAWSTVAHVSDPSLGHVIVVDASDRAVLLQEDLEEVVHQVRACNRPVTP